MIIYRVSIKESIYSDDITEKTLFTSKRNAIKYAKARNKQLVTHNGIFVVAEETFDKYTPLIAQDTCSSEIRHIVLGDFVYESILKIPQKKEE